MIVLWLGIAVVVWFLVVILREVLSWHGLLYSFGMAAPGDLTFPGIVRTMTFALIVELCVLVSASLDWREGMRFDSAAYSWLMAHATLVTRIVRLIEHCACAMVILSYAGWTKMTDIRKPDVTEVTALRPGALVVEGEVLHVSDDRLTA
jgi:hypothetical protein